MKHFRQKSISAAAFTALLLLSLACGLPPARPPRPFPIPPTVDDNYGSPLSHPDRQFPQQPAGVNGVAFDLRGRWMAAGGEDRVITIWDFRELRIALQLRGQAAGVTSIAFSPDGKSLASGSQDGSIRIWDART